MSRATAAQKYELFKLLAAVLSYPTPALEGQVAKCISILETCQPEAATELEKFQELASSEGQGRLEEIYSAVFDLSPSCPPYAGYYLFGDTHKRGDFMVKLKEDFISHGFDVTGEMPDHMAVLLEFIAVLNDNEEAGALISDCLVPALTEMESAAPEGEGYHHAIRTVLMLLKKEMSAGKAAPVK